MFKIMLLMHKLTGIEEITAPEWNRNFSNIKTVKVLIQKSRLRPLIQLIVLTSRRAASPGRRVGGWGVLTGVTNLSGMAVTKAAQRRGARDSFLLRAAPV